MDAPDRSLLQTERPPLVSIVTPSFNQVRYLETTLRSVLEQDYPRIEYIVIDGGSTDGSLEVLDRYRERLAYCVSEPDAGQAAGINKGLRLATGEFIAWLNSDDVYLAGAIRQAVQALEAGPDLGMVYADGIMVDSEQVLLDRHRYRTLSLVDLLSFEVILQPTVFMRRAVLKRVGYLDDAYQLILDHELWVRMAAAAPVRHVDSTWALERTHPEAKTIARASGFVDEAERLLRWAGATPPYSEAIRQHRRRVHAGFNVFAARRLIDGGEYRRAFDHMLAALRLHPPTVARYWYKFVQAAGSALGLADLFFWYRRTRRRVQHGRQQIDAHPAPDGETPRS
jgi:glycosyltransferase involved in cell wall biosynthesis